MPRTRPPPAPPESRHEVRAALWRSGGEEEKRTPLSHPRARLAGAAKNLVGGRGLGCYLRPVGALTESLPCRVAGRWVPDARSVAFPSADMYSGRGHPDAAPSVLRHHHRRSTETQVFSASDAFFFVPVFVGCPNRASAPLAARSRRSLIRFLETGRNLPLRLKAWPPIGEKGVLVCSWTERAGDPVIRGGGGDVTIFGVLEIVEAYGAAARPHTRPESSTRVQR